MEQQLYAVGWIWMVLYLLAPIATLVVAIMALRRRPSIPEELYRNYVTKSDLAEVEARWERRSAEQRETLQLIFERIDALAKSLNSTVGSIDRAVARIEGRLAEHLREHDRGDS